MLLAVGAVPTGFLLDTKLCGTNSSAFSSSNFVALFNGSSPKSDNDLKEKILSELSLLEGAEGDGFLELLDDFDVLSLRLLLLLLEPDDVEELELLEDRRYRARSVDFRSRYLSLEEDLLRQDYVFLARVKPKHQFYGAETALSWGTTKICRKKITKYQELAEHEDMEDKHRGENDSNPNTAAGPTNDDADMPENVTEDSNNMITGEAKEEPIADSKAEEVVKCEKMNMQDLNEENRGEEFSSDSSRVEPTPAMGEPAMNEEVVEKVSEDEPVDDDDGKQVVSTGSENPQDSLHEEASTIPEESTSKRDDKDEADSEKYDSAVEDMETDNAADHPNPAEESDSNRPEAVESGSTNDLMKAGEEPENQQQVVKPLDDVSNTSSHLQDIEITNVDESDHMRGEDMAEGDRSIDPSTAEDPFDQLRHASTDDISHGNKDNRDETVSEMEMVDKHEPQDDHHEDNDTESRQEEGQGDKDDEQCADETLQSAETNIGEENTVDESAKESTSVGEQTAEDESNAVVDERGGENENICLLPDDERAISDEDNQRAMEQEEAAAEQESLAAEREEAEVRSEDVATRRKSDEQEEDECRSGSAPPSERETVEEQEDPQTGTVEQPEEMEVDLTGNATQELPKRVNQIRELATLVESETCLQCKKETTPCLYTLTCDTESDETAEKYICSFDCVQRLRTEHQDKFELIQRRISIVPILEHQEICARCGEQHMCKYRYKLDDTTYTYLCDLKCVEHLTAINGEKYSLMRKRYNIEERALSQEEDKRCVQCGDTKPCQFGFKQDEDELHVCNDCLNLLMTEHPDLFRLHRRRSVRVRNLGKESAIGSGGDSGANTSSEVVKFTARTEEEAEAARIEREASFLRTCNECHKTLQILSSRWLQWETMEFCDEKCLGSYQTTNGSHCVQCRQVVSVNSMGKFCVRFGFSICQFCSAACLEEYKKVLKSCSYCQQSINKQNKSFEFRVARAGEPGVLKDFCSAICHKMYQACLNPTLKHKRHVCAVCNHEKMTKVIVHLEGREHYFCSTPCFSAFKFVNNVNPDECAMCKDFFERKSTAAYTIYRQGEASHLDPLAFCTKMCLNLYISTNREIVPCNWCKVKKYTFDMILRPSTMERHCSLHCLTLCEVSSSVKLTPCDHCRLVRTAQYELNMTDSSLRIFCTYQCLMKFQSQFNKSQPIDPSIPVPMGIPKRIPRATTTATITQSNTAAQVGAMKMSQTGTRNTPDAVSTASSTITTPRTRGRPPKSTTAQASSVNSNKNGNIGSASNLPVITSVHSLAGAMGNRGTRSKVGQISLNQKNWPELRVALEPLTNIPPSGRVALSSILPNMNARTEISLASANASSSVAASGKTSSVTAAVQTSTATQPPELDSLPASELAPISAAAPKTATSTVTVTKVETHTQIVTIPPTPTQVANAATMCKPIQLTKSISCRPIQCNVGCQTDDWLQRKLVIPIPVPIYVPVPMFMYSMPTPVPVPIPLPIPVPVFVPTTRNSANGIMKEIKKIQDKIPTDPYEAELLMMAEMVAGDKKKDESDSDSDDGGVGDDHYGTSEAVVTSDGMEHNTSFSEDLVTMALKMASNDFSESQVDLESAMQANTITQQQQQHHGYGDLQQHHHPQQQLLLLEPQRQVASPVVQRGRKRGSNVSQRAGTVVNNNTQQLSLTPASKRIKREQLNEPSPEPVNRVVEPVEKPDANMCLKYTFGVNAWKQWVVTKNADLEKSSIRRKPFKSDILQLTADELNYSLCLFVNEVRKPNGTEYAPDTIYYLVLGIQQYLFQNQRVENIFTDPYYERFTDCLDEVAKKFSMLYNDSQFIVTRVEEEHLWECKQLGAHSPHVLLSTLMFFNTKHFNLVSVEEHMELSFSHIMKHWKRTPQQGTKSTATRNVLLRFYPPQSSLANNTRKKKVYEQQENEENPLRCPVKLYEFYLSKCPESVKTRNDVFYLQPERSCVPDSPVWYSTQPLSKEALTKMLHRVKMVKEINIALLTS
uniref:TRASH domain-containing protein n=1 Tax=Anopheles christyi TaxID=43041 RepID=A0A182JRG5_9DIPT